ncbi:oxidoreductase [Novosphingobium flavum]|uniref:Oxidoreductase n=1 Tax=Novosphingobium flavum TaxID=1778672 RepID=A0A7X1KMW9_9SPHN|nr:oxidoreductase [Novosphingobium flavum]MBC2666750.1 oxidoreductase [Novosphingobium flavum]
MQEIGVGLIGYGLGGKVFHAAFITRTAGMRLRAVVSRDPAKVHHDHPEVAVVPHVDELLTRPDIDLVVVASPDELHAGHALAALAAGKHVVVDKPFATSLADARRVVEAAERSGKMLTIHHNRRWDADFLTLQDLIASGRLGRIVHFESRFDRWRPEPGATWKEARAGGSWLDLGPHLVDQALVLFGMPTAVTADLAVLRDGAPAPDWFEVILHYEAMRVTLHSSKLAADHRLRFAVHGTTGTWLKHGIDPQEPAIVGGAIPGGAVWGHDPDHGRLTSGQNSDKPEYIANRNGDYGLFWRQLVAAIHGEGANPVPAEDAIQVMTVIQAGLDSAQLRRTVDLVADPV